MTPTLAEAREILCRNCGTLLDVDDADYPYCNRRCWSEFAQENSGWYDAIDNLRDYRRSDDHDS